MKSFIFAKQVKMVAITNVRTAHGNTLKVAEIITRN